MGTFYFSILIKPNEDFFPLQCPKYRHSFLNIRNLQRVSTIFLWTVNQLFHSIIRFLEFSPCLKRSCVFLISKQKQTIFQNEYTSKLCVLHKTKMWNTELYNFLLKNVELTWISRRCNLNMDNTTSKDFYEPKINVKIPLYSAFP